MVTADFKYDYDGTPTYWRDTRTQNVWKIVAVSRLDPDGRDIVTALRVDGDARGTCMMYADLFFNGQFEQIDMGPAGAPPIFLTKREKWLMFKVYYEAYKMASPLPRNKHERGITEEFEAMLGGLHTLDGLSVEAELARSAPKDDTSRPPFSSGLPLPGKKQPDTVAMQFSRYYRDVSQYQSIDVYRVLWLFEVTSQPVGHAIKKLLAPGKRGGKSYEEDIKEAIASLQRELSMLDEDSPDDIF